MYCNGILRQNEPQNLVELAAKIATYYLDLY